MRRFALLLALTACSSSPPRKTASPPPPPSLTPAPALTPALTRAPAPAAEPKVPPYDLAADRERRLEAAKAEMGGKVQSKVVADIFVMLGAAPSFDPSVSLTKSAMDGYLNGRFAKKPERAISVYLFPNAATYEAFCKKKYGAGCISTYGFYEPNDRYMVMNIGLGIGTLTHEIVHPLVEADFPNAPTWINEGIASVFEQPIIPKPGEIHGGKNWRLPRLRRGLTGEHTRLDGLFGMSDETFRGDGEDLHYAQARYVCQWLDERGKLWPFYQRWRDTHDTDPTGEKAFAAIVGMTPAEAHAPWSKWVLAL